MTKPRTVNFKPGDRVHDWEVIEELPVKVGYSPTSGRKRSQRMFLCRCTRCGVTVSKVALTGLRSGGSTMCVPCGQKQKAITRAVFRSSKRVNKLVSTLNDQELGLLLEGATDEFRRRCHG
jgi:hypothetical protein